MTYIFALIAVSTFTAAVFCAVVATHKEMTKNKLDKMDLYEDNRSRGKRFFDYLKDL